MPRPTVSELWLISFYCNMEPLAAKHWKDLQPHKWNLANIFILFLHTHTHTHTRVRTWLGVGLLTVTLYRSSDKLFWVEVLRLENQISLKGSSYVQLLQSPNDWSITMTNVAWPVPQDECAMSLWSLNLIVMMTGHLSYFVSNIWQIIQIMTVTSYLSINHSTFSPAGVCFSVLIEVTWFYILILRSVGFQAAVVGHIRGGRQPLRWPPMISSF